MFRNLPLNKTMSQVQERIHKFLLKKGKNSSPNAHVDPSLILKRVPTALRDALRRDECVFGSAPLNSIRHLTDRSFADLAEARYVSKIRPRKVERERDCTDNVGHDKIGEMREDRNEDEDEDGEDKKETS